MNRKLRDIVVIVAVSLALVWCIPAMGQVLKGSISGTVTDPQGNVVAGATVTLINAGTNTSRTTTTTDTGVYSFEFVPPGDYRIEVESTGFKKAT